MKRLVCVLPFLLSGCIQPPRPEDTKEAKTLGQIDRILAERRAAVTDMNADVAMSVEGLEKSGSFTGIIVTQRPDRFRMDAIKRMGPTLFVFTMSGDQFLINVVAEGKFVRGSVKGQERKHPELVAAFAWLDARHEEGETREIDEDAADHVTIVTKRAGKVSRREWLSRPDLFTTKIALVGEDGNVSATVEMSDYRSVKPPEARPGKSAWVPWKIELKGRTDEGKDYRIEMGMSRVYINDGVEPGTFDMEIPQGATVEEAK
jgi:outer membrane lipoprotein-sorting protein